MKLSTSTERVGVLAQYFAVTMPSAACLRVKGAEVEGRDGRLSADNQCVFISMPEAV